MPLDFTAIDFETANSSPASACSVGMVKVRDGRVVDEAQWLIRPTFGGFSMWNTRIHGITEEDVIDAATWAEQLGDLISFAENDHLVAHNAGFDMGVIRAACDAHLLPTPGYNYLCTLQLARKTYHLDSYRLPVVAMAAGFEDFSHHDALEDARACAAILVHAARRHDAPDVSGLVDLARLKLGTIGTVATPLGAAVPTFA